MACISSPPIPQELTGYLQYGNLLIATVEFVGTGEYVNTHVSSGDIRNGTKRSSAGMMMKCTVGMSLNLRRVS
jgi:hypothetical protein